MDSVSSFKLQLPRTERTRDREECFCRVYEQQRSEKIDLLRTASVFVPASSRQGSIVSLAVPRWKRVTSSIMKGGDPRTDQLEEGDDSDPGLASRRDCDLSATKRGTLEPAWVLHTREGAQRPQCVKGRGPMDNAFCRASAYSSTTGPLEGGSACVSPFAGDAGGST